MASDVEGIELRPVTADEAPRWMQVIETGFGEHVEPGAVERELTVLPLDRTIAAVDRDRIVGGAAAYGFTMSVPGGGSVPAAGVTAVAVSATHRRRGILRAIMRHQLDDVVRRGEPMAILNASEAAIYGRFGYGLASGYQRWTIDPRSLRITRPLPERPPLRLVPQDEAIDLVRPIHDAAVAARPGMVHRSEAWWRLVLGPDEQWKGGGKLFVAVAEPFGADPGGYAVYSMRDAGAEGGLVMRVRELTAATPDTEVLLWHLLTTIDLVRAVEVDAVPIDDELRWWVSDPRAVRTVALRDYLWVRLLDVPAALAARGYGVDGSITLEVVDEAGYASGTYRLDVDAGVGTCARQPDGADADVRLDVGALGAAYLGGVGLDTLARAGRVQAVSIDALAAATALLAGGRAPFCDTRF